MSEWWTYTLSDFLLFSARTYYRLFEIYNAAIWPAQIVAVGLGVAIIALLRRAASSRGRIVAAILAACWLWVAIAFHAKRYATINTASIHFAWAFGVEAALLIWMGVVSGRLQFDWPEDPAGRVGLWIFLFALVVEPLVGPLLGRGWKGVEIFGVAPDPTAVATFGLLLLAKGPRPRVADGHSGGLVRDHRCDPVGHESAGRLDRAPGGGRRIDAGGLAGESEGSLAALGMTVVRLSSRGAQRRDSRPPTRPPKADPQQ